jgi:hypothetical protein
MCDRNSRVVIPNLLTIKWVVADVVVLREMDCWCGRCRGDVAYGRHVTSKDLPHAFGVVCAVCHVLWGAGRGLPSCRGLDLDRGSLKISPLCF